MTTYVFRSMYVPAAFADFARAIVVAQAGESQSEIFKVPRSPNGKLPATYFIAVGMIDEEMVPPLTDPQVLADQAGMPLEQCTALLSACDVSEDDSATVDARLGVRPIIEDTVEAP